MAEELRVENTIPEDKPVAIDYDSKAGEQGWVPLDQWTGDPAQWRPAKEFLDRGELFKKIEEQGRSLKEVRKALDDLARHHAKVKEVEYKRALEELKRQKKEALVEGNADEVVELDDKIEAVREAQRVPAPAVQAEPVVNPIFLAWKDKNPWYDHNIAMRGAADTIGNKLAENGMSPADILAEVERQIKKEFAHKFENPRRNAPGAVESSSAKGVAKKEEFVLTEEQRRVMRRLVSQKVMTEAEYIDQIKGVS